MYENIHHVYKIYYTLYMNWWIHITPMEYGYLLISVGIGGWLLMKGSAR